MNHWNQSPRPVWIERFLDAHLRRRPVDATFIGAHEHDGRLPDVGPAGLEERLDEMCILLREAEREERPDGADPAGAPDVAGQDGPTDRVARDVRAPRGREAAWRLDTLDRLVATGSLRLQIWEHESRWLLSNPSIHVGEVVFGLMSLLLPGSAPKDGGIEALESRMYAVPGYLAHARAHLEDAPAAWTRRAIRECRGGLTFLERGLDRVDADLGDARRVAAEALRSFEHFLRTELMRRTRDQVGCGADALELHLSHGHFLDRSAEEIAAYARDELERTRAWLEAAAADFGDGTPQELVSRLRSTHPSSDGYYERYGEIWQEMRALAEERRLLTWPDFPIRYVPRPGWSREAAPDLYFLFYRSPAAFARPEVHDYLVAPLDPADSKEEQEAFLRANNDSVIKLNHVVHHGGIGHHVQNWHAFRSPLRIGRIAAVDCASRIAMFCGGTMAEGWACYATDLMAEAGGLTPLETFAEHHGRVRMCARAIVDVELHTGRMSLAEAASFYAETAGMSPSAAEREAVKNSMFPGAALMYLVGSDMIHELRADLMRELGDTFSLSAFHDGFLSYGSIPVRLIAGEMKRRAEAGLALNAHAGLDPGAIGGGPALRTGEGA